MVDDMVGGVGGGVLLDSDLRNMVDLVLDLVANMLDNWSCGNMVGSRGNSNSWGSLHFNSLDLSNSWGSNMVSNWGSNRDNWSSMSNRVNKPMLINILRKSLQRKRCIATVSCDKVTNKRGQRSRS